MTTHSEPVAYDDGSIGLEDNAAGDMAAVVKIAIPVVRASDDAAPLNRQGAWFAVTAVMAIAWFPYMASCLLHWVFGNDTTGWPYIANSLWEIVQHLAIVAVVLYVMYCDGRPWSTFGIRRPHWLWISSAAFLILVGTTTILGALYLLSAGLVGMEAVDRFSESAYQFETPTTLADYLALVLLSWSVGLSEELVMRGYLIPTFERLLRSTWLSILLTSALFASYHVYQVFGPMLWIFGIGLMFGAIFCRWRHLWPLVLAHAAMDMFALAPEL
jgi:membrane protease YdiL (CAAX protease family)